MTQIILAPLAFVVLRLTCSWRWRTVLMASLMIGLAADLLFDSRFERFERFEIMY